MSPYDHKVQKETLVREYQVALASMRLVRERLAVCVRTENVNQFVNCRELREQYHALCKDNYNGMIFPEGQEPATRKVSGMVSSYYDKKPETD